MTMLCYKDKERLRKVRREVMNIKSIDDSIREYLIELNSLGYLTYSSCSGFVSEHKKMENWSKRRNKSLSPSVSIFVKYRAVKKILFNLQQTLHGTGWNAEYPAVYRCYTDGRKFLFCDSKACHLKRMGGYYVPIHIRYATECDDMNKKKAWDVLIQLLRGIDDEKK